MATQPEHDAKLAALRGGVEEMATRLVLDGARAVPAASLAELERLAHEVGLAEFGQVAREALEQLGTAPLDDAGEGLSRALIRMQEILSAPPPLRPREAAGDPPAGTSSLVDDPVLVRDFLVECREHLSSIEAHMLEIERDPGNAEAIHTVFRGFHTIKGLAGFLDLNQLREVAHETETVLDLARNGKLTIAPETVDVILAGADYLQSQLSAIEEALKTGAAPVAAAAGALLDRIRACAMGQPAAGEPVPSAAAPTAAETPAAQNTGAASTARTAPGESRVVRVDTAKLDHLVDMAGEMIIAESMVRQHPDLTAACTPALARSLAQLGRITAELQRTAMSMRMEPIGGLFQRVSRLARDVARKSGKLVSLRIAGADTELDRNIVEELADPLMHMVRNSIDHGIEPPEARRAAGKPPAGTIALRAAHQGGHIVVEVGDDGRGLDRDRILARARGMGLVREDEALTDNEVFNLIFRPGFSTAVQVTDISGRGVGMDVVRKHIQNLRGRVDIHSTPGEGTRFLLQLPLTLAIIDALVVGVGRERYVIPLHAVREMFRPTAGMVFTIENRKEMALVRGTLYPIVRLGRSLGVAARAEAPEQGLFIVAEAGGRVFCLMVDELIGKQEVVIKTLGEMLGGARGVAGAAILGDGRVRMIVDLDSIAGMDLHG